MKLFFVTSNYGKFLTLQKSFSLAGRDDINVVQKNMDIVEPQFNSISEISKYKALQAYEELKAPIVVEDGGFVINALNGFPGVYTKYVLETIGIDGILKLLEGVEDRTAKFLSIATFIDAEVNIQQFERDVIEYDISLEKKDKTSPFAWSELWKIIYVRESGKLLCDFSKDDLDNYYKTIDYKGSLEKFSEWFVKKY